MKRLRGWQLEKELTTGKKKTLEKGGSTSKLATALLSFWAHGKISAVTCRWLAECATLDGCQHPEICTLAKAGCHGLYEGNIHRDILTNCVKDVFVPDLMEVTVRCLNTKTLKKGEDTAAVFLPHMMFSQLATLNNFNQLFPLEDLERFWTLAEQTADERLQGHPMKAQNWKKFTVPLFLHGDGVQYASTNLLMVYSWGSLMTCFSSLQSKFLISCGPKTATCKETWDDIMKEVKWSFRALLAGTHPTHDSAGKPFFEKKGKPLASGYKAVLWCIMGDAEFYANSLYLAHWASKHPCMEYNAVADSSNVGRWFKTIQMEKQKFTVISNAAALEKPGSNHLIFHEVPGLSTKYVRGDALHILFCSGIYSHLLGSVLHHLCWYDGKGKQAKTPAERLSVLWESIQKTYKKLGSTTRLSNLRLSMFTDVKQPHQAFPTLSIKGSEAKHLLPAMLMVCKTMLRKDIWHEKCMPDAMESMVKLVELYDNADIFLEEKEWKKAFTLGKGFLDAYSLLHQWASEQNKLLFNIVYKFHSFQHMLENSKFLNPRAHWCFSNEDFGGKMSLLTYSISSGVGATRLSMKVAPKYKCFYIWY